MLKDSKYTTHLSSNYQPILDAIFSNESNFGTNLKAYKPNSVGALGGYQMRKKTYEGDLQFLFPNKWGTIPFARAMMSDSLAREATNDYMQVLSDQLVYYNVAPSEEALLAAYHSGAKNVALGNIGPRGRAYVKKGIAFLRSRENA